MFRFTRRLEVRLRRAPHRTDSYWEILPARLRVRVRLPIAAG